MTALALMCALPAQGADWSITEAHLTYGNLDIPTFAGGSDSDHFIYTLQHASGWQCRLNKHDGGATDESTVQALLDWKFRLGSGPQAGKR